MITVHVRRTDGFIFDVSIKEDATIEELRKSISTFLDVELPLVFVIFRGSVLPDHLMLETANIKNGTKVGVAVRQKKVKKSYFSLNFDTEKNFHKSGSTGNIIRKKAQPSKEQLLALDSRMTKIDSNSKASISFSKHYVNYQNMVESKEENTKEITVIPEPTNGPSIDPLPVLIDKSNKQKTFENGDDQQELQTTKKTKKKNAEII